MDLSQLYYSLLALAAYKHLAQKPILKEFIAMLGAVERQDGLAALDHYTSFFFALKQEGYDGLDDWLWDELRYEDSPFGRLIAQAKYDPILFAAAQQDVETLLAAAGLHAEDVKATLAEFLPMAQIQRLPVWKTDASFDFFCLRDFYRENGCGPFARYRAFRWEKGQLVGISHPDIPDRDGMYGYSPQRQQLLEHTQAFVAGQPVNNVLLYGDPGTGKSATVKSMLAQPCDKKLKMVELDKDHLEDIPALLRLLQNRPYKFILFLDDLAFDQDDKTYSQLKTILEGSLARRPDNVVIYATTNRRNLVRQTFSDRAGDEIDRNETIEEKTSLAERFGTRIAFFPLSPKEFLSGVEYLAHRHNLNLDQDALLQRAKQWELRHPGRTPRSAMQFVLHELQQQA